MKILKATKTFNDRQFGLLLAVEGLSKQDLSELPDNLKEYGETKIVECHAIYFRGNGA